MSSVNMFVLSGNLGAPPEERSSDTGKKVCSFRIANNRWDTKKKASVADWYTILAFGSVAETCLKHLDKGASVVVEGRTILKEWESKDGAKHKSVDVLANRVTFFGSARGAREASNNAMPDDAVELSASEAVPF